MSPPPAVAERVVHMALQLHPDLPQQARLWEFMADAWTKATLRNRVPSGSHSPFEAALESLEQAKGALGRIHDGGFRSRAPRAGQCDEHRRQHLLQWWGCQAVRLWDSTPVRA